MHTWSTGSASVSCAIAARFGTVSPMIGRLRGTYRDGVVDTAGGVGYTVAVCSRPTNDTDVDLYISTIWRDSGVTLYGFDTPFEREVFDALCRVNRVGPGMAMALLRTHGAGGVVGAVRRGDPAALKGAPGVGAKTCDVICALLQVEAHWGDDAGGATTHGDDLLDALTDMGFDADAARRVLEQARRGHPGDEAAVLLCAIACLQHGTATCGACA